MTITVQLRFHQERSKCMLPVLHFFVSQLGYEELNLLNVDPDFETIK
jgi:hypothetical protein